jgi:MFS family permease
LINLTLFLFLLSSSVALFFQTKREQAMMEPAIEVGARRKTFFQTALPVFACGAGLFSDGYVNNVIGSVNTVLKAEYGTVYTSSNASKYVSDIAFVGTVVGQLFFGFLADRWSRSNSLLVSTVILIVFTALATGSYYHGDAVGMFNMLTAWRFFVGIGIGGMCLLSSKFSSLVVPKTFRLGSQS